MKQRVIFCISREYGSGGRVVGERLAEALGIPFYDKKLLEETAAEHGVSEELVAMADEQPVTWSSMGFPRGIRNPDRLDFDPVFYVLNDKVFALESQTIKRLAAQGSCVIVGRAAEWILKDDPDMISVFIQADLEDRIRRIMEIDGVDHEVARQRIRRMDKSRADYHNYYAGTRWGQCSSYHVSISTSRFGVEGAVRALLRLVE